MWLFIRPSSQACLMISVGKVESLSSSQATGRISFSAKSWASCRMSFCSSVSVKSTTWLMLLVSDARLTRQSTLYQTGYSRKTRHHVDPACQRGSRHHGEPDLV